MPPDIESACKVAERKCTACHDRERWLEARHSTEEWRDIVDEMRLLPGSGITLQDADDVMRCFNYRSLTPGSALRPLPPSLVAEVAYHLPE